MCAPPPHTHTVNPSLTASLVQIALPKAPPCPKRQPRPKQRSRNSRSQPSPALPHPERSNSQARGQPSAPCGSPAGTYPLAGWHHRRPRPRLPASMGTLITGATTNATKARIPQHDSAIPEDPRKAIKCNPSSHVTRPCHCDSRGSPQGDPSCNPSTNQTRQHDCDPRKSPKGDLSCDPSPTTQTTGTLRFQEIPAAISTAIPENTRHHDSNIPSSITSAMAISAVLKNPLRVRQTADTIKKKENTYAYITNNIFA